jgi:hypothetical protein
LREGQITELIEDDEIEAGKMIGDAALSASTRVGLETIDEIDDVVEAAASAAADAASRDCDREMRLARPRSADEDGVALLAEEGAGREIADERLVDRSTVELETRPGLSPAAAWRYRAGSGWSARASRRSRP